jgi:hypothetical protein
LVGAAIPGFLEIDFPGVRAGGALAIFALIFLVNPPKLTYEAYQRLNRISLKESAQRWVTVAQKAREASVIAPSRPLPNEVSSTRAAFEKAWQESSLAEKRATDASLLYKAISMAAKTHRVEEGYSESKSTTFYWSDVAIAYFEEISDDQLLAESLLDKAAVYLELSQLEHTDREKFRKLAEEGDQIMARAYTVCSGEQKSEALRIWSRFYYNLARPESGDLSDTWDNNYLFLSYDKMQKAFELKPDLKNVTQWARIVQRTAANPPQDKKSEWTKTLRSAQRDLYREWQTQKDKVSKPEDRIPPLDILAVITMDAVKREWMESSTDARPQEAGRFLSELDEVALPVAREAIGLLKTTPLAKEYHFDLYYDLGRIHATAYMILQEVTPEKAPDAVEAIITNMTTAWNGATTNQAQAALHALDRDPVLTMLPKAIKEQLTKIFQGGA